MAERTFPCTVRWTHESISDDSGGHGRCCSDGRACDPDLLEGIHMEQPMVCDNCKKVLSVLLPDQYDVNVLSVKFLVECPFCATKATIKISCKHEYLPSTSKETYIYQNGNI